MTLTTAATTIDADRILSLFTDLSRAASTFKFQTSLGYGRTLLTELPSLKSQLRNFQNTVLSVQTGIGDRSISQREAKQEIQQAIGELETKLKVILKEVSDSEDQSTELNVMKDSLVKYDLGMNELQTRLTRSHFFVGHTSILPVTQPALSVDALKANGFKAESFHGYPILSGQMVAGLTVDYMRKKTGGDEAAKGDPTATEVFDDFVSLVLRKYAKLDLIQIGKPIHWWDASWVWLIPSRQFKVLRSCSYGGKSALNLAVKSWGFPFDRK
jgi:hypothetical protein